MKCSYERSYEWSQAAHRGNHRRGAAPALVVGAKQAIVAESVAPRASPTMIARRYGLNTGQLYTWRRQMLRRVPAVAPVGFARVDVVEAPARPSAPAATADAARSGLIEVILPGGASVRVDGCVDERALRRVLNALRG